MFLQIIHALIYSPRRQVKYIILISLILILSACSMPKVHKIIIQQGNIVNQEMVDQLKPGMTKTQVAYVCSHKAHPYEGALTVCVCVCVCGVGVFATDVVQH